MSEGKKTDRFNEVFDEKNDWRKAFIFGDDKKEGDKEKPKEESKKPKEKD